MVLARDLIQTIRRKPDKQKNTIAFGSAPNETGIAVTLRNPEESSEVSNNASQAFDISIYCGMDILLVGNMTL